MGTIVGTTIINRVATLLFDTNNVFWSRQELLGWLNDAQRAIVAAQPSANNITAPMKMVAGSRQTVPGNGWNLVDIYRNLGTDGATPGRAVRVVPKKQLDQFNPNWHFDTPSTAVQNFILDAEDQTGFWVYPPSDGTGYIETNCSQPPTDLPTEAGVISLNDIFEPIMVDYICYRACEKRAEFAPGPEAAKGYFGAFTAGLASEATGQTTSDPENSPGAEK